MKDPALLWYFNDWMGGTATMSRHLKGCYIDLLCVQFNSGPLSLEDIKTVLGSDFGSWPALQKKFKCENNLYFNQRLQDEKDKRVKFTESRRKNGKHMPTHMEDININEDKYIWLNKNAWKAWEQHRIEKRKPLTPTSLRLQLRFLEENKEDHVQIIKNSITNGWTGLFPLKEKPKPKRYVEPDDSKEMNERKNILRIQASQLASSHSVKI